MRSYDSDTLAMLSSGRAAVRDMILFDFASGLYGFWTGAGTLTYAGLDYIGAGKLFDIEDLSFEGGLAPSAVSIKLSAIPEEGLTPDVLASIESENYHQRPVTISRAYIHPDTRALLSVERVYRGYLDQMQHDLQVGGGATLTAMLESRSRDHTRVGHRVRSDADQRMIDPADGFFRHAPTADAKLLWGRNV
ncbi:MAG: hypothetical protein B7Y12_12775 [Rhizobiales bacterium 24-66-13]|jgi:hypothetical protein|nr:MAG: hypothetical protein B7Y12_12775 [Rhizobiales bacterium 24-66-13]